MLIIKEDTLIHTDSSSDVIEHHGVKGMKWGRRAVKKAGSYAKDYARMTYNNARHPISTTKAELRLLRKAKLLPTHKAIKYKNKFVADDIKARKDYRRANKDDKNLYKRMDKSIKKDTSVSQNTKSLAVSMNKDVYKQHIKENKQRYKDAKSKRGSGIY